MLVVRALVYPLILFSTALAPAATLAAPHSPASAVVALTGRWSGASQAGYRATLAVTDTAHAPLAHPVAATLNFSVDGGVLAGDASLSLLSTDGSAFLVPGPAPIVDPRASYHLQLGVDGHLRAVRLARGASEDLLVTQLEELTLSPTRADGSWTLTVRRGRRLCYEGGDTPLLPCGTPVVHRFEMRRD